MNEPVAYVNSMCNDYIDWKIDPMSIDGQSLYTHSAKTLTDFEIRGVMALDECWIGEDCSIPNMIAFARAILRKAEEK